MRSSRRADLLHFGPPPWDFDPPLEALPNGLPDDRSRNIFSESARATYRRLPGPVSA
jgi:hypothetical protein